MSDDKPPMWKRIAEAVKTEVWGLHPRLHAFSIAANALPRRVGHGARARLLNLVGFSVGEGTRLAGAPKITGGKGLFERLQIGRDCSIDQDCVFDLEEKITLGDRVTIGPGVMILTSTHELASALHRAGTVTRAPVVVGEGAWLRARSIILPGVTIGAGAIVDAGAVVNKDVAPNTRVGGVPAAQLEELGAS
jgi:maltose O-acetyltransferase